MVDLLVIGGGINGAGIARDAAGRGLSVVLVERGDLASATSSSSSKLIHGGLRYLEQFELRHGFAYSDCRVDDARLVVCNAMDARERGARILMRTECLSARREGGQWIATLAGGELISARALVNASGPWVKQVLNDRLGQP